MYSRLNVFVTPHHRSVQRPWVLLMRKINVQGRAFSGAPLNISSEPFSGTLDHSTSSFVGIRDIDSRCCRQRRF